MTDDNFSTFTRAVADSFQERVRDPRSAFVVGAAGLHEEYLAAFPDGTDPAFKTTTEHDCRCCRHFIRRAGAVVTVDAGGELRTVWDRAAEEAAEPYRTVASRLRAIVRAAPVVQSFS